jgi:hypothetical protein
LKQRLKNGERDPHRLKAYALWGFDMRKSA